MVENGQAVGVEICDAPAQRGDMEMKNISVVKALRQLVVCAGALGTPPILERSGIGSRPILEKLGIDMKVDLPGVGKEYQDHQVSCKLVCPASAHTRASCKGTRSRTSTDWMVLLGEIPKFCEKRKSSGRKTEQGFWLPVSSVRSTTRLI